MKIKMINVQPKPVKKRDDSTGVNWNARYEERQTMRGGRGYECPAKACGP
jgi:hypothetical protein